MSAEAEQARCARVTLYRLLARVYARELDKDAIGILASGGIGMLLAEAAPDEPLPAADLTALQVALGLGETVLARAYARLFLVGGPGSVPPYESFFVEPSGRLQSTPVAAMTALLRAHGLAPSDGWREPLDHLSVQLELLAEVILEQNTFGERLLRERHLRRWVPGFTWALERYDPGGLYAAAGAVLRWLLDHDAARERPTPPLARPVEERVGA
jgi:TorA-specific chaperone